jgi:hypothetical protein
MFGFRGMILKRLLGGAKLMQTALRTWICERRQPIGLAA